VGRVAAGEAKGGGAARAAAGYELQGKRKAGRDSARDSEGRALREREGGNPGLGRRSDGGGTGGTRGTEMRTSKDWECGPYIVLNTTV